MPWKSRSVIGERWRLVKELLRAQKPLAQVCRSFGLSRPSAYKWLARFQQGGRAALRDGSSRPKRSPRRTAAVWVRRIRALRRAHRHWGAKKIAARLPKRLAGTRRPSVRTIGLWLKRLKLARPGRRRARRGPVRERGELTVAARSNQVWTVDFKGWFRTRDGQRVEPLTVRDLFSRYILGIVLLPDQSWRRSQRAFARLFSAYGKPAVIRVDNGGPFASIGPAGLSRLSAWRSALGIDVEFIRPGHPEDNGAHEQMHRVFKKEMLGRPSLNLRSQSRRVRRWVGQYNRQRPHEALEQKYPAEVYRRQRSRGRIANAKMNYPRRWERRKVRSNGQIKWEGRLRFIGEAFVGYAVGLKAQGDGNHEVYFGKILLGELRRSDAGGLRPTAYVRPRRSGPTAKA